MPRGRRYCGSPSYTVVLFKNFSQKNPVFSVDPLLNVSLDRCLSSFSTNTRCSTSTITSYSPLSFLRRAKKSRLCWFTCVNEFVLINNLLNLYIVWWLRKYDKHLIFSLEYFYQYFKMKFDQFSDMILLVYMNICSYSKYVRR